MPQGLEVYTDTGTIHLDGNSRTLRLLGSAQTGLSNGSTTVAGLGTGSLLVLTSASTGLGYYPVISQNGNVVSWTFDPVIPPEKRQGGYLIFIAY